VSEHDNRSGDLSAMPPEYAALAGGVVESGPFCGLRALLAEDNPTNQLVAVRMLHRVGLTVDIAENGDRAVAMAGASDYDLIFMDLQMPKVDGFAAAREIRTRRGDGHRPVIIAMTANAVAGARERCLAAGMDDFVAKPVAFQDLEQLCQYWLDRRET
jgi:CheY-like chemotaxis protein